MAGGRVWKNRSWRRLLGVSLIVAAVAGYVAIPKSEAINTAAAIAPAIVALLFLALALHRWRVCARNTNWLLREAEDGLYVQTRSYLNYHLPQDVETVLFFGQEEILGVRI